MKKRTKREQFLSEMEAVLPWSVLLRRLKPLYPARGFQGGSPPYPVEMMLRIHLMQHWWSLNDEAMEDALIEMAVIRRFAGIHSGTEKIPDAAAMLVFRRFLEKHHLRENLRDGGETLKGTGSAAATRCRCRSHHHRCPHLHQASEKGVGAMVVTFARIRALNDKLDRVLESLLTAKS